MTTTSSLTRRFAAGAGLTGLVLTAVVWAARGARVGAGLPPATRRPRRPRPASNNARRHRRWRRTRSSPPRPTCRAPCAASATPSTTATSTLDGRRRLPGGRAAAASRLPARGRGHAGARHDVRRRLGGADRHGRPRTASSTCSPTPGRRPRTASCGSAEVGASGMAEFASTPPANTRLYAQQRGCAFGQQGRQRPHHDQHLGQAERPPRLHVLRGHAAGAPRRPDHQPLPRRPERPAGPHRADPGGASDGEWVINRKFTGSGPLRLRRPHRTGPAERAGFQQRALDAGLLARPRSSEPRPRCCGGGVRGVVHRDRSARRLPA